MANQDDILKSIKQAFDKQRDFFEFFDKDKDDISDLFNQMKKNLGDLNKSISGTYNEIEKAKQNLEEELKKKPEQFKEFKEELKQIEEKIKKGDPEAQKLYNEFIEKLEKITDDKTEENKKLDDIVKKLKDLLSESAISELQKQEEQFKLQSKAAEEYAKMLKRLGAESGDLVTKLFKPLNFEYKMSIQNGSAAAIILRGFTQSAAMGKDLLFTYGKMVKENMDKMLSFSNIALNIFSNIVKQTKEGILSLDETTNAFEKATGLGEQYNDLILEGWENNRQFNISLKDMSESYQSLLQNMRGFTELSMKQKEVVSGFAANLAKLGVGIDSATKLMAYFSDSLGQNEQQVIGSVSSLIGLSKTTGDTMSKIVSDFQSALPTLAKYGTQANSAFRELYATAKSLKMETSSLLQIAEGFDTFETAAKNVGRLNAVLGGPYLNSIEMMGATEAQRIQMLNQSFKMTGQNFTALDRYTKQAIMAAAGITSMTDAEKLFSGSLSNVSKYLQDKAVKQEELNKLNERAMTIQEKLTSMFVTMGEALSPLLNLLTLLLDGMKLITDHLGIFGIPVILYLTKGIWYLTSRLLGLSGIATAGTGSVTGLTAALTANTAAITAQTAALAANAQAAGAAAATGGASMTGFAAGLAAFSTALAVAAPKLALAILLIGGSIAVVVGLFKIFSESAKGIGKIFSGLGEQMSANAQATKNDSLTRFMKEINSTSGDTVGKVNSVTSAINNLSLSMSRVNNVGDFEDLFEEIGDLSNELNNTTAATFMDSLSKFIENSVKLTPEKLVQVKNMTEHIANFSKAMNDNRGIEVLLDKIYKIIFAAREGMKEERLDRNKKPQEVKVVIENNQSASTVKSVYVSGKGV